MNQPARPQIWVLTSEYAPHIIGGLGTSATNLCKAMSGKGMQVTVLSRKYKAPIIYTLHSIVADEIGPRRKIRKAIRQQTKLLRLANKVVVPSRAERRKLLRYYPYVAKKTAVIKHGVRSPRGNARGPAHHLLYVGRLVPVKGIKPLIQAFAIISRQKKQARLFIIGKGPKGYTQHLKSIVRRQGLRGKVRFLGYRKHAQVQRMYASFGAVVVPSQQESFGLVALEALSSGVPLVSTRSGGLSEIVNPRVAEVIPRANKQAIAKAILHMWRNRNATKRRMIAGRMKARQHSWPRAAAQYKQLFRRMRRK